MTVLKRVHFASAAVVFCVSGVFLGCTSSSDGRGAWQYGDQVRWASLADPQEDGPGFERLDSSRTGVGFENRVTKEMMAQNRILMHGSGVAVGDVNGDGWPDLYITSLRGPNRLYLNRGDFEFDEIRAAGGAAMNATRSTGAVLADLNGDHALDLVVTTMGGQNRVFHNDGSGQFVSVSDAGLHAGQGSTTMALSDVNGDGYPDLYVGNYKRKVLRDSLPPSTIGFEEVTQQVGPSEYTIDPPFRDHYEVGWVDGRPYLRELAEADRFYLNDGDGTFTVQPWQEVFRTSEGRPMTGVPRGWALVARLEDLNGDGHADLYVCNDFESPDLLFWGTDDGHFVEAKEVALRTTSHATMSIATSDVARNGATDFFLADMLARGYEGRQTQISSRLPIPTPVDAERGRSQEMQNTLQLNRGDGTFVEVAELAGVEASGWTWSSRFLDVDLDGYEDLIAVNGHAYNVQNADSRRRVSRLQSQIQGLEELRRLTFEHPRLSLQNVVFRNKGDGTFEAVEDGWGLGESADVGHGMATGDFDRDGDLDVVINRLNRSFGIYRNEAPGSRVAIRLAGRAPNTAALGAEVRVDPQDGTANSMPEQTARVIAGGEYLSDSERLFSFAMGEAVRARIEVTWPDGAESERNVQAGRIYEIKQSGAARTWTPPEDSTSKTRE